MCTWRTEHGIDLVVLTFEKEDLLLLLLKLYLHTVFSSGFNMQQTKLDKYKSRTTLNRKYNTCFS
jgi:hypothetical protein